MTTDIWQEQAKYNARAISYLHAVLFGVLAGVGLELGYRCQMAGHSFYAGFLCVIAAGLIVLAIAGVLIARSRNRYSSEGAKK